MSVEKSSEERMRRLRYRQRAEFNAFLMNTPFSSSTTVALDEKGVSKI